MSVGAEQDTSWLRGRPFKSKSVALLFMLACFAGAGLVGWHWGETHWAVRRAELGGLGSFSHISWTLMDQLHRAVAHPWVPILGLTLLAAGGVLGRVVAASHLARRLSMAAAWTLVALAGIHVAEDWLLSRAVAAAPNGSHLYGYTLALQGVAFLGYALLPAAGLVALLGGITTSVRLAAWAVNHVFSDNNAGRDQEKTTAQMTTGPQGGDAHWRDSSILPRSPGGLGICLSGGGIRSATFGLGALQALQQSRSLAPDKRNPNLTELTRAAYLTAVSGGAYAAGALLLATHPGENSKGGRRNSHVGQHEASASHQDVQLGLDEAFRPGSPEFDHLRKHGSYIADSFREWVIAILVVIRGAFLSMLFLGLVALTAGRWVGFLYHQIGRKDDLKSPWHPVWGPVFATLVVAVLALVMWLGSTLPSWPPKLRRRLAEAATMTSVAAAVMVILGALIPIVTWASMTIIGHTGGAGPTHGTAAGGAAKGGILAVSGVIITIAGLLLRRRSEMIKAMRKQVKSWWRQIGDIGGQVIQWLAVYLGLALVAVVYLIIFGYSTWVTAHAWPDKHLMIGWGSPYWTYPLTSFWLTVALTAFLVIVYLLVDETVMGLHPFYRRRLASAFAVRRVRCDTPSEQPARYQARCYDWEEETKLETYGKSSSPQVIFCAAAHCSDPDETPPGRHVLPFTFSHDAIGGPEVHWCPTTEMRDKTSRRLQADLTVETAMAVSGAAFASATGTYRRPADVVLALMNARLGTWFANPRRMEKGSDKPPWWRARPPRIRRLSYLVREIMGWYPKEIPLLFVTDGGLYDNLGLVELLRHRCTEIYCFDASSDTEAFAASFARAITLAYDELGVRVIPDHPEQADPRVGGIGVDAGDLRGRLADTAVMTAKVEYPPLEPDGKPVPGILIVGRAALDPETPWEIRRYAAAHRFFPNDATGDQWFNDRKFNAYTSLGRYVGACAVKTMGNARHQPHVRPPGSMEIAA